MKTVFESFSKGVLTVLVIGAVLAFLAAGYGIPSMKPAKDFDYLLDNDPKEGMHIKGKVLYTYDCFASEETYTKRSDGTQSMAKTSHYYYVIPTYSGVMALEVPADAYKSMEKLLDETIDYMMGGAEPSTAIQVDGCVKKMSTEMKDLLEEYLEEAGYTQAEIADMGPLLVIKQPVSMSTMRTLFLIGIGLILIAVIWFVINCVRHGKEV